MLSGMHPAAAELCRAFGFDPNMVKRLDLHLRLDDIATAEVEQFVDADRAADAATIIRRFTLTEIEPPADV